MTASGTSRYMRCNRPGLEARGFADGGSFWAALEQEKPALVVLDVMLPGVSGIELLRRMKRARPRCREIPVVMATAKGAEYDQDPGAGLSARTIISTKPFGVMELVSWRQGGAAPLRAERRSGRVRAAPAGSCVHLDERTVTADGERIALTYKEFELLRLFLSHPGHGFHPRPALQTRSGAWTTAARRARSTCTSAPCARSSGAYGAAIDDGARCRLPVGGAGMTRKIFRSIVLVAATCAAREPVARFSAILYGFFGGVQETQLKDELTLACRRGGDNGGDLSGRQLSSDRFRLTWIAANGSGPL